MSVIARHPLAGKPAPASLLVDVPKLVTAYYAPGAGPDVGEQRVAFGTSGHRGTSLDVSFNETHILAITEAICRFRKEQGTDGPLFLGWDTHALSEPARVTALEVLAAHGVSSRTSSLLCWKRADTKASGVSSTGPRSVSGESSGPSSTTILPR
ncbi:MAG TPA: hypothetical protein VLT82_04895, partial [Myxococcaceae bacterium]|nr:hypothetical protein [Myxococcaceae bacterium]